MDARGGLPVGRVDEAEDLAVVLIDPVALVVHAVLALDPDVGFVCRGDIGGFHPGDVVNVHVRGHSGLLARIWSTAWWSFPLWSGARICALGSDGRCVRCARRLRPRPPTG